VKSSSLPSDPAVSHDFGNNQQDGHQAHSYEYKPKWETRVDYNPDHRPSSGWYCTKEFDDSGNTVMFLHVRGLGVLCFRLRPSWRDAEGKADVGVTAFSVADIGHADTL
jgi:hypothetical protein